MVNRDRGPGIGSTPVPGQMIIVGALLLLAGVPTAAFRVRAALAVVFGLLGLVFVVVALRMLRYDK